MVDFVRPRPDMGTRAAPGSRDIGWPATAGKARHQWLNSSIESPFVFVSERGSPFTTAGYRKMIARLGEAARFKFPVHPHMFRPRLRLQAGQ
jgi:integrase